MNKILPLFSTPVGQKKLSIDNKSIEEYALSIQSKAIGRQKSMRNGWQSNNVDDTILNPLKSEILNYTKEYKSYLKIRCGFRIDNMWININNNAGMNVEHRHPGAILSGVYYVKCNDTNGNLFFSNPNPVEYDWGNDNSIYEDIHDNIVASDNWNFVPKEGDLYLFPSWAKHGVISNTSNNNRISISFNLINV